MLDAGTVAPRTPTGAHDVDAGVVAWSQELFRLLPQPVLVCRIERDATGAAVDLRIEHANAAALSVDLPGPIVTLGALLSSVAGAALVEHHLPRVEAVERAGGSATFDAIPSVSGRWFCVSVLGLGPDLIAIVATDITEREAAQAALEASEARYRGAIDALRDGVLVQDAAGTVVAASPNAAAILGLRMDELIGRTSADARWEALHEDGSPFALGDHPGMVALRTGRSVRDLEMRLARPDGRSILVLINAEPIRDASGTVTSAVSSFEDITERRAAEQALAASEARYRSTLDDLAEGAQILDPDWRWVYVNRTAAEHRRGELAGAVGQRLFDIYPGIEMSDIFARFRRCMEAREPQEFEAAYEFADGEIDWFDFRVQPVPEGIFVLSIDVTERHRAQAAIQAREEDLRRTTAALEEAREIAGLGVWRWDPRTGVAEWSPAMFAITGLDPADGPPSSVVADALFDPETVARRNELIATSGDATWELEARIHRLDGEIRWATLRGVTELDADGRPVAAHGTALDITVRKRAEAVLRDFSSDLERRVAERTAALEAANEELRSFTYSVSHDLRAPVRSIAGFARIMELRNADQLDADGLHRLHNIVTAGETMGRVIDDLLAYSRVGRGAVRAEAVPLDLVLERVITACAAALELTGGTVRLDGPAATPVADPTLLEVALLNLVQNALTYRRSGVAPEVVVTATHEGERVAIAVTDNGVGIPTDAQERIFEPFYRLEADESRPGTGIGLAIARRSARAMDGDVRVTSTVGAGSTFVITLPAA